ncbi:MAG: hypothetical protein JWM34_227 [Ilumatobacteraceae bacterium]|nr:hypothetical protein [Ilumatobacteraceae bacterium]
MDGSTGTAEPVRTRVDAVLDVCDSTCAAVFVWLCRIAGGDVAEVALPEVYARLVTERLPLDDPATLDDELLRVAHASALAAGSVAHAPFDAAAEASADDKLSITDRALVELHAVRGRSDADIATILGIPEVDVAGRIESAEAEVQRRHPDDTFAEIGRRREAWLDDGTRSRCRTAVEQAAGVRPSGEASPAPRRGPARSTLVIGLIAVAVLIIAVVIVRGDDSHPPKPASGPTTTTLPDPRDAPGYVIGDPPLGLTSVGALVEPGAPDGVAAPAQLTLWSSPGATRTSGTWFIVVTARCASIDTTIAGDATRVDINGNSGLVSAEPDGVVDLRVETGTDELTSHSLAIKEFGLTDDELTQIASSVLLGNKVKDPSELAEPSCTAASPDVTTEFDASFAPLHAGLTRQLVIPWYGPTISADQDGAVRRVVQYTGFGSTVLVTAQPTNRDRTTLQTFLGETAPAGLTPSATTQAVSIGGRHVVASSVSDASGVVANTIETTDGDQTIDITSPLPQARLLAYVDSLRVASTDEWSSLRDTTIDASALDFSTVSVPAPSAAPLYAAGTATTALGTTWQMLVGFDPDVLQLEVPASGSVFQTSFPFDGTSEVHPYLTIGSTAVVVTLTDASADDRVRVTIRGENIGPIPLVHVHGSTAYFALLAFDDPGLYVVHLIDPSGRIVRQLYPHP